MGRIKKVEKQQQEIDRLEKEFRELLITALKDCRDGGPGIFLLPEKADRIGFSRFVWPETKELETLGEGIRELRLLLGLPLEESIYEIFLKYCNLDGSNAPGGAKRAAALLKEIGAS
jgi:hypothetical protein